jgi:hypothetical protein
MLEDGDGMEDQSDGGTIVLVELGRGLPQEATGLPQ